MTAAATATAIAEPAATVTADPLWYHLVRMQRRNQLVNVVTASGAHVQAMVARRPDDGNRDWWFEVRGEARIPMVRHGATGGRFAPVMWRPRVGNIWRDPLGEPITFNIPRGPNFGVSRDGRGQPWRRDADDELDEHRASDGWPYPGLALGRVGEPPRNEQEAEARLLRALRTSRARDVVKDDIARRTRSSDIPVELQKAAERFAHAELLAEALREGRVIDTAAVRSGWTPTRRDLGEWWLVLAWMQRLSPLQRKLFEMRSADPPHGPRAMARAVGCSHTGIRDIYADAVIDLYKVAVMR